MSYLYILLAKGIFLNSELTLNHNFTCSYSDALRQNIERIILYQQENGLQTGSSLKNISVESGDIPVNYTNETGYSYWAKKNTTQRGWPYMDSIKQSTVFLAYSNSTKISTSFYWYKTYGWSPGHTSFMDNCNVVIANLGLHYKLSDGFLSNNNRNPPLKLDTDLLGMITYLTDFASSGDNVAIYTIHHCNVMNVILYCLVDETSYHSLQIQSISIIKHL